MDQKVKISENIHFMNLGKFAAICSLFSCINGSILRLESPLLTFTKS